jgi:hypothetical protein
MADGFKPGDVLIDTVSFTSNRGTIDYKNSCLEISVYESIFQPTIIAEITVVDTDDNLNGIRLLGDEIVQLQFTTPGRIQASYTFGLLKITEVKPTDNTLKSKSYVLSCTSQEAFHAKTNVVQKSYNSPISDMIQNITQTYLHSNKQVITEPTQGSHKIIVPNMAPLKAIEMLRTRAVSAQNKSSIFLFFETREASQQSFKFYTLEQMFKDSVVRELIYSDTVGSADSFLTTNDWNNIIHYEILEQVSSLDRISIGGTNRISTYNFRTRKYDYKDVDTDSAQYTFGGKTLYDSISNLVAMYVTPAKIPPQLKIPNDRSQRPATGIPDRASDKQAYASEILQNNIRIEINGDTQLACSQKILCHIPQIIATTGDTQDDPSLSGEFVISRLHHQILTSATKPRYTTICELLKGALRS